MDLKPGNLVLAKADAFKGKRKIKDRWEDKPHKVVHQIAMDVPSYEVTNQCRQLRILHHNQLLVASEHSIPLCVGVCHAWERCTCPTPVKPTPQGSESEITPWVDSGLVTTQSQASKTFLGLINGKLQLLQWTSAVQWLIIIYLDVEYSHSIKEGPLPPKEGWPHTFASPSKEKYQH